MTWAEFEEKEYEIAFAVELALRGTRGVPIFACGQVLEKILGYDAIAAPDPDHVIWRLLGVPRPTGIRLLPAHWPGRSQPSTADLPSSPVGLVLQYKRPEYLYGATAGQWRLWRSPYYRFSVYPHQQRVLHRLERGLGSDALVRYAAPAFWRRGDLEAAMLSSALLDRSGFVGPSVLKGHRVWTYSSAGRYGRANPRGSRHPFPTLDEMFSEFFSSVPVGSTEVVRRRSIEDHLRLMGALARERQPGLRAAVDAWLSDVAEADIGLTDNQIELVGMYASTTSLLSSIGASWHILGERWSPTLQRRPE